MENFQQRLHTISRDFIKLKILIKINPARTYWNTTVKRIDNLFAKTGIFFLAFPSYHSSVPRGCERKRTEPELLLLIKAVNQESDFFPPPSIYLSLDLFVSLWSKPWWKQKPTSSTRDFFSCLFNGRILNANFWCVQSCFFFCVIVFSSFIHLFSLSRFNNYKNIWFIKQYL